MIALIRKAVELGVIFSIRRMSTVLSSTKKLVGKRFFLSQGGGHCHEVGSNIENGKSTGLNSRPEHIIQVAENRSNDSNPKASTFLSGTALTLTCQLRTCRDRERFIQQGKVEAFRSLASERTNESVAPMRSASYRCSSEYSLMWRQPEEEVCRHWEELGIGLFLTARSVEVSLPRFE